VAIFGFKGNQTHGEQLAARDNDDVEARRDAIPTKNLSNQALRAISRNRSAEPFRRGNS